MIFNLKMYGNEVKKTSLNEGTVGLRGKNKKMFGSYVVKLLGNKTQAKVAHKDKVLEKSEAIVGTENKKGSPKQTGEHVESDVGIIILDCEDEGSDGSVLIGRDINWKSFYDESGVKVKPGNEESDKEIKKVQKKVAEPETKQTLLKDVNCSNELQKDHELFLPFSHVNRKRKLEEEYCCDVQRPKQPNMFKMREKKTKDVLRKRKENLKKYAKQERKAKRLLRLERCRQYMSRKRNNMTEEERISQSQKRAELRRQRLEKETEEQRQVRLRRRREKLKIETEKERIARLAKRKETYKRFLEKETEEERRKRLYRQSKRQRLIRQKF